MPVLVFDENTAPMLGWVLGGADSSDYGSYVTIDVFTNDTATISTNTTFSRSLEISIEPSDTAYSVSIPAVALSGISSSIDEGEHLTLNIDEYKEILYVSCGTTTITLDNMFYVTPQVPHISGGETMASISGAFDVIDALSTAAKLSPKSGSIHLDSTSDEFAVSVVSGGLESREIFPSTIVGDDEYHAVVASKKLSPLNGLKKIDFIDRLNIKQTQGALSFIFPLDDPGSAVTRLEMSVPTVVAQPVELNSPCEEDIVEFASVGKSDIKGVLSPLTAVVAAALVTVDTTAETNGITLTVKDQGTTAKTVVMDAVVHEGTVVTVPLSLLMTALRNITTAEVILGTVAFEGTTWLTVSPSHEDDEDTGAELIIALREQ